MRLIFFVSIIYSLSGCISIPKKYLSLRFQTKGKYHYRKLKWNPHKTAVIVVDMWDKHNCMPSEQRSALLAKKINHLLPLYRNYGMQIIFAPSSVVSFYDDISNRKKAILIAREHGPFTKKLNWLSRLENEPPMPIQKGCEDEKLPNREWSSQHRFLKIKQNDLISADGNEIENILKAKQIHLVLYVGVHSNVCVLSRSFGMRNLKKQGFTVVLIRDLTDSYSKKSKGFPSQKKRNKAVVNHIETYIAPTIHSNQFKLFGF